MITTGTDQPTREALVHLNPRLVELRADVEAVKSTPGFCANRLWYGEGGFRDRMSDLVGWSAGTWLTTRSTICSPIVATRAGANHHLAPRRDTPTAYTEERLPPNRKK